MMRDTKTLLMSSRRVWGGRERGGERGEEGRRGRDGEEEREGWRGRGGEGGRDGWRRGEGGMD